MAHLTLPNMGTDFGRDHILTSMGAETLMDDSDISVRNVVLRVRRTPFAISGLSKGRCFCNCPDLMVMGSCSQLSRNGRGLTGMTTALGALYTPTGHVPAVDTTVSYALVGDVATMAYTSLMTTRSTEEPSTCQNILPMSCILWRCRHHFPCGLADGGWKWRYAVRRG